MYKYDNLNHIDTGDIVVVGHIYLIFNIYYRELMQKSLGSFVQFEARERK